MLELINEARREAAVPPLTLGQNRAAQLHAESMAEHCFLSDWGIDGHAPGMRYSLAGGYQLWEEIVSNVAYCRITPNAIEEQVASTMAYLMGNDLNRASILHPAFRMVNIGLAQHSLGALQVVQLFEADYVSYTVLPSIDNRHLSLSGHVRNGAALYGTTDLGVDMYFDPPPHPLTVGQVIRANCYDNGLLVASLRPPTTAETEYIDDELVVSYKQCPNPHDVPADSHVPRSAEEASDLLDRVAAASTTVTVPWVTASEWRVDDGEFAVVADIGNVLDKYGDGVYRIVVWALIDDEAAIISEYSIFHGISAPDTYSDPQDQE